MKATLKDIEVIVAAKFKLSLDQLRGPGQCRRICRPRQIAMYLGREITGKSLPQLGRHFGRDHSTVYKGILRIRLVVSRSEKIATAIAECREEIAALENEKTARIKSMVERLHQGEVSWRVQTEAA